MAIFDIFSPEPTPASLPPSGSAGGDLSGTYPNPTVVAIDGYIVPTPSGINSALTYTGSSNILAWLGPVYAQYICTTDGYTPAVTLTENQWVNFGSSWSSSMESQMTCDGYGGIVFTSAGVYQTLMCISFSVPATSQLAFVHTKNGAIIPESQALITVYGSFTGTAYQQSTISNITTYAAGDILASAVMLKNNPLGGGTVPFVLQYGSFITNLIR